MNGHSAVFGQLVKKLEYSWVSTKLASTGRQDGSVFRHSFRVVSPGFLFVCLFVCLFVLP